MKKNNLIRRFTDKEEKRKYTAELGEKNIFFSKYIVMAISVFELCMIIFSLTSWSFDSLRSKLYLSGYFFLFFCSVICCLFAWFHENKRRLSVKTVEFINIAYTVAIIAWSIMISVLDSNEYYQLIVFLTVVMGATNAVHIRVKASLLIQVAAGVLLLLLLCFVSGSGFDTNQTINLFVFMFISIAITLVEHNRSLDAFRQNATFEKNNLRLIELNEELNSAYAKLMRMATLDPLTNVKNRTTLNQDMEALLKKCKQAKQPMCCAILDVDDFKKVNDTFGHLKGDESLCAITEVLRKELNEDSVYRFGGEEFVFIDSAKSADEIYNTLERVRSEIEKIRLVPEELKLTASIGFCVLLAEESTTVDTYLAASDSALYCAKQSGKNRVQMFE